jgi:Flp pilus assembly protein TadD
MRWTTAEGGASLNRKQRRQAARKARAGPAPGAASGGLQNALAAAAQHRVAGRFRQAETLYRKVLEAAPGQHDALHWLGVLEHLQGRNDAAERLLEQAAAGRPDDPLCLYHLAEVRRARGRNAEAVAAYRIALKHRPDVADVHFGLGTALLDLGEAGPAAESLRRAVELAPGDPEARNNLGNALAELGEDEAAEAGYRRALALRPEYSGAHLNLGILLARRGRDAEAETCYRAAVATDPASLEARLQLARFLRRIGRLEPALKVLREATALSPDHAAAQNDLGRCLVELGRSEEALAPYRRALELRPDFAEAHFNLGVCLQSLGRFDEAVAAHERALALRPDLAEAHYNLSLIAREGSGDEEVTRLDALLADPDLAEDARVNANFALAALLQRRGEADRAFTHYRQGNELKARSQPFDAARYIDYVDSLIATFDGAFFASHASAGTASDRPVLIVGMPRSGTTLVEQILASHPAVHGAGELDDLLRMVDELPERLGGGVVFPECAREIGDELAATLAGEYLDSLRRRSADARRVTDKMTGNYLRLGLVARLLPGARVIHCQRDPLDTCLSCYFQNFARGLSFSYDLGHLGLVYRQYERLMTHWRDVLPLPILDLRYEDLIADQEAASRRIVAFCDLPWDDSCLRFHEEERQVRTASFWQVRQPLYASSVGRWRAFAAHLGPLFEALGEPGPQEA